MAAAREYTTWWIACECTLRERCSAVGGVHVLIICKHVFNVSTSVVLAIFVRRICLLYSFVASFSHRRWRCRRRRRCFVVIAIVTFYPVSRTEWNIRTLSCHFRRRVQFPEVSSVGNAFNIYCLLFFSILISTPSFTHSLLHSTIAAEDATPTVKFHKFSRFSQTKRFHSCIKYIARECQKVRGGVMH